MSLCMIKINYCNTVTIHINGNPILGYVRGNISKKTKATATYSWLFLYFKIEPIDKMRTKIKEILNVKLHNESFLHTMSFELYP